MRARAWLGLEIESEWRARRRHGHVVANRRYAKVNYPALGTPPAIVFRYEEKRKSRSFAAFRRTPLRQILRCAQEDTVKQSFAAPPQQRQRRPSPGTPAAFEMTLMICSDDTRNTSLEYTDGGGKSYTPQAGGISPRGGLSQGRRRAIFSKGTTPR
jgi:hypothetical protein